MNSNLDPHIQLEEWLVDGAANDPPREMAFHASMCDECLSRLNAFDSLSAVDVGAAGSPPPLPARTTLKVGLAWARVATAAAGGILALILVVAGASQLIGFVGHQNKPDASLVAVASATEVQTDGGPIGTFGPGPATEPSPSTGPTPSPIPTFIALPSVAPNVAPLALPYPPYVTVQSVGQTAITIRWTSSSYGGPVQKWEIWRTQGGGPWLKQGELGAGVHSLSQSGLYMNTVYHYRLRAVNTTGLSGWSNTVAPKTTAPTPTPTPGPGPQCSDGVDNDSDGWIDFGGANGDPGRANTTDNDESPQNPRECNDGVDNDSDGWVDFGGGNADPGCADSNDNDESPQNPRECNDGVDNDSDGWVDFGGGNADPGCADSNDNDESPQNPRECNDGVDNDGDGWVDFGGGNADPQCGSATGNNESPQDPRECNDGNDNDGDGYIDMSDPSCSFPTDNDESPVDPAPTLLPLAPVLIGLGYWQSRKRRQPERGLTLR